MSRQAGVDSGHAGPTGLGIISGESIYYLLSTVYCILSTLYHMLHPHQSFLDEFQIAINAFVPTVPAELKIVAQTKHDALAADLNADEITISAALYEIGVQEYPHRQTYHELASKTEEAKRLEMVLEHVDETVRAFLKRHIDNGVPLDEIVRSELFETELNADQRYQVEDAILDTKDHLEEAMHLVVDPASNEYQVALAKWTKHAQTIQTKLEELVALADKDPKNRAEILGRVAHFREGFSVTERDPELADVENEIEYWRGMIEATQDAL